LASGLVGRWRGGWSRRAISDEQECPNDRRRDKWCGHEHENDLQMMLMVINATDVDDAGYGLPWSTMETLETLVPGQRTAFTGIDVVNSRHYFGQGFGAGEHETHGPDELPTSSRCANTAGHRCTSTSSGQVAATTR